MMRLRAVIRLFGLLLLTPLAGCDLFTRPDTGHERFLGPDTAVTGQLAHAGDSVVYTVRYSAARPWRLHLRALSGYARDTVEAVLSEELTAATLAGATSSGGDSTFAYSDWVTPVPWGRYTVKVRGRGDRPGGSYEILLRTVGSAPETVPRAVELGDTIAGESLDVTGDVDEFVFHPVAGQEALVFLQSPGPYLVWVQVIDSVSGDEIRQATSEGDASFLELASTGVFSFPAARPYLLRVHHGTGDVPAGGIPYRFQVQPMDRAPETVSAAMAVGDTLAFEAIDYVGDIDEYEFTGIAGTELVLFTQLERNVPLGVQVELLRNGSGLADFLANRAFDALDSLATRRVALPDDGSYTVRVTGIAAGAPTDATGRYRLELYRVDQRPEHVAAASLIDLLVQGEQIDRIGDVDEFRFAGTAGQEVNVLLDAAAAPLYLLLYAPDNGLIAHAAGGPWGGSGPDVEAPGPGTTERIILPASGDYRVRVENDPASPRSRSPFTWRAHVVSREPEFLGRTVVPGDTVRGEAIEPVGDVDTFEFDGEAGQELVLFVRRAADAEGGMEAKLRAAGSDLLLAATLAGIALDDYPTRRITLPATGTYEVEVVGAIGLYAPAGHGGYEFVLFPIDRVPESVPAAIAVGDTVRGESLFPVGDIDEFTITAAAGDTLEVRLMAPTGPLYSTRLEIAAGAADSLVFALEDHRDDPAAPGTAGLFAVPWSGTYVVRILCTATQATEVGAYVFSVTRAWSP